MRITMKQRRLGSPDGHHVHPYIEGETYHAESYPPMSDDLASVFLREGWAIDADAEPEPGDVPVVTEGDEPGESTDESEGDESETEGEPTAPTKRAKKVTGPTETKTDE